MLCRHVSSLCATCLHCACAAQHGDSVACAECPHSDSQLDLYLQHVCCVMCAYAHIHCFVGVSGLCPAVRLQAALHGVPVSRWWLRSLRNEYGLESVAQLTVCLLCVYRQECFAFVHACGMCSWSTRLWHVQLVNTTVNGELCGC